MTVLQIIRKRIDDTAIGADGASVEMRVDGGYIQWRQDDDTPTWANLIAISELVGEQGPVGAMGAPGGDGAPGISPILRTYFGTIQWSNDDGEVWHHLLNLTDITPPRVEFAVNENVLFWRYVGEGDEDFRSLFNLMSLKGADGADGECDCDDGDDSVPPQNLQMNRCGVAVALTLELKRLYQRIKTDPTAWDSIEAISGQIGTTYNTASAGAAALAYFAGITVAGGVAVAGSLIAAGLALINWVAGRANNGTDNWTLTTEEHLQENLYCVLSRRETVTITADVLREWLGFVNDADISGDNDYLIQLLSLLPVSYWNNEALVAAADINSCLNTCAARTGDWAYLIGEGIDDLLNWDDPIIRASASITLGKLDDYAVQAIPTPNDTLLYTIQLNFGRTINLHALNFAASYIQSRNVVSPIISVLADGVALTSTQISGVNGPVETVKPLNWVTPDPLGYQQVQRLTVSGTVAVTDSDTLSGEFLKLDYMRICGRDYAPFGEAAINSDACDEEPLDFCDNDKNLFTDPTITGTACFDFRVSTHGWVILTDIAGRPYGEYVPGLGFRSKFGMSQSVTRRDRAAIRPPTGWAQLAFLRGVIVEYQYVAGPGRNQAGSAVVGARSISDAQLLAGDGHYLTQGFVQQIAANAFQASMESGVWVPASYTAGGGYCVIKAIKLGLSGYVPPVAP